MNKTTKSTPIRKIFRWVLKATGSLLVVVIIVFVVGILVNLKDEPLSAQAQALMAVPKSAVDSNQNGYFVLSAMDADVSVDVLETGRKITEQYERLFHENPNRIDYDQSVVYKKAPVFNWAVNRCKPASGNCLVADLHNRAQLEVALQRNALLLRRYEMIQQLPRFEESRLLSMTSPLPSYALLTRASDMAVTRAVFAIADGRLQSGIDQLKTNDKYLRRMLQQTSTLISRMITLAMMRRQVEAVSELVETYPVLVEQYGKTLADLMRPMSQEEQNFAPVLANEAGLGLSVMNNLDFQQDAFSDLPGQNSRGIFGRLLDRVCSWFYQPHATLNKLAAAWSSRIHDANQPSLDYAFIRQRWENQAEKLNENPNFPYVHYLSNPMGKLFLTVWINNQDTYVDYMERSADVDGYLRLVGLQIDLRRKNISENAIEDYLRKSDQQFRSPYGGEPMKWVADKKQLEFIGRQNASSNLDGHNVFVVQLSS